MERYTKRMGDGQAVIDCQQCKADWMNKLAPGCTDLYCRNRLKDRVADYEDTGLEPQEIEKIRQDVEAGFLKQTARRYGIDVDRIRELVEADQDGRCVVLPKDGMVYYIEEGCGEKWVANKPIQQITVKCGWGLASLEFSLLDTGKYFSREAAEAELERGQKNGM